MKGFLVYFILFSSMLMADEALPFKVDEIPDWKARLELASILSKQKKYDESMEEIHTVLKEHPGQIEALLTEAEVLSLQEKEEEAEKITASLEKIPLTFDQQIQLASVYTLQKQFNKAKNIYVSILEKTPSSDQIRLKLAEILSFEKNYPESITQFHLLLDKYPNDLALRRKYAFVLSWMGEKEKAAQELKKTLKPLAKD